MSKLREPLRELLRDPIGDAQLDAIWRRVEARRRPRTLRRALVPALVAVAAVMIVIGERWPSAHPATQQPASPTASPPAALHWSNGDALSSVSAIEVAPGAAKRMLALSDGTRVELASGSRLVPSSSTTEAVELALEHGEARFEVAPQGARRFEVQAGALRVRVVGTAFTVSRDRNADVASVVVEHGRVRVYSPTGEALLGAGDVLRWPAETAVAPAAPPPPASAPQPQSQPQQPAATHAKTGDDLGAWRAAAADGDYRRAYELLGARGYALVVRDESNVDVLLELADVARGAGHPRDAALALARVVQRYPHDARSPLAALTLGRLQLDALGQPSAAERTLRRALDLGLPAALQEDALARLVQASAQAGDVAQARSAAGEYRKRFANGRYRASVDQWSNAP